ncbi:hypothetical protein BCD48_38005 [Pseudofrankia sp. BMG5.36]|nr:hypothetical protein BCD48_38005 [Pseudofrankia sp. BMG5.36]
MIDVHTHVVPPEIPFGLSGSYPWQSLDRSGEEAWLCRGGRKTRAVKPGGYSLAERLDDMREAGVEIQVLSMMPALLNYEAPADEAAHFCSRTNEWIADQVASGLGKLVGLGVVPMQEPDAATQMLGEVSAAGLRGVEIGSSVAGVPLCDARYRSFFAEAARLDLALFVHAGQGRAPLGITWETAAAATSLPNEIGAALAGLIIEGIVRDFPRLRICASHGAGSLVMILPRLDRTWRSDHRPVDRRDLHLMDVLPETPSAYARRMWVDCLVFAPAAFRHLEQTYGTSQIVVGSDYPFGPDLPGLILDQVGSLPSDMLEQVTFRNARRFLGLPD